MNMEPVRDELRSQHPDDPYMVVMKHGVRRVVMKHGVRRVKGLIQVPRSIGDAYLKRAEFNREPLLAKFRLPEPFNRPILSLEPSVCVHRLQPEDQFMVFASDGLWEHLSHQEVADIVDNYPGNGIAKWLIKAAARKREMRYSDLKKIDRGVRRHFHNDITVVVLFLDLQSLNRALSLSIKGHR